MKNDMKEILFVQRHPPYGSSLGKAGLDAILMGSALARITVLFMDDGVFQLRRDQDASELDIKDCSATYPILPQYDVEQVYVADASLAARGLTTDDLVMPVTLVSNQEIAQLMATQTMILSF